MNFKSIILATALAFASVPALANNVFEPGSDRVYSYTNTTIALTATNQTVNLAGPSRHVVVSTTTGSTACYFRLDGTAATTSNFQLPVGGSTVFEALPVISQVSFISTASPTGNISIIAW